MVTQEQRGALCAAHVTLDGKPANICGRLEQFAIVARLDGAARIEITWPAVARIVAAGGKFKS